MTIKDRHPNRGSDIPTSMSEIMITILIFLFPVFTVAGFIYLTSTIKYKPPVCQERVK